MFKKLGKKTLTILLTAAMFCSGVGMFSVSAAGNTLVDECNDLSKVYASMAVTGIWDVATAENPESSVWEVKECPYVAGEKFLQRKELANDPFGAWLVYTLPDGSDIEDFKFTMNNYHWDYTPQVNVYLCKTDDLSERGEPIDIKTSELVKISGDAEIETSTFTITPDGKLPAGMKFIMLETLREYDGLGVRKAEINPGKAAPSEPTNGATNAPTTGNAGNAGNSGNTNPSTGATIPVAAISLAAVGGVVLVLTKKSRSGK